MAVIGDPLQAGNEYRLEAKKVSSGCASVSARARISGSCTEELFEGILKTNCTLVGLGARFVYDFQRF